MVRACRRASSELRITAQSKHKLNELWDSVTGLKHTKIEQPATTPYFHHEVMLARFGSFCLLPALRPHTGAGQVGSVRIPANGGSIWRSLTARRSSLGLPLLTSHTSGRPLKIVAANHAPRLSAPILGPQRDTSKGATYLKLKEQHTSNYSVF